MAALAKILTDDVSKSQFLVKFHRLSEIKPNESFKTALTRENLHKNRYQTVIPYDYNRVTLKNSNDYINASWINIDVNLQKTRYVASQGPLKDTVDDFWCMIWQEKITTVIMLTETFDSQGKEKCYQYWSKDGSKIDTSCHFVGAVSITRVHKEESTLLIVSDFVLSSATTGQNLKVKHYYFKGWPDMEVPDKRNFIHFYDSWKKHNGFLQTKNDPPMVTLIHCSAGIGRTGTLILIETMIQMIDQNLNVDPLDIISQLRGQRMGMVETDEQILFACEIVLDYYNRMILKHQ